MLALTGEAVSVTAEGGVGETCFKREAFGGEKSQRLSSPGGPTTRTWPQFRSRAPPVGAGPCLSGRRGGGVWGKGERGNEARTLRAFEEEEASDPSAEFSFVRSLLSAAVPVALQFHLRRLQVRRKECLLQSPPTNAQLRPTDSEPSAGLRAASVLCRVFSGCASTGAGRKRALDGEASLSTGSGEIPNPRKPRKERSLFLSLLHACVRGRFHSQAAGALWALSAAAAFDSAAACAFFSRAFLVAGKMQGAESLSQTRRDRPSANDGQTACGETCGAALCVLRSSGVGVFVHRLPAVRLAWRLLRGALLLALLRHSRGKTPAACVS